jgi:hypothetical protein
MDHLEALTLRDFTNVVSDAQSGHREAQYLMALVCGEGRLVPKDFAVARRWMLKSAEQGYVPAQGAMGEMYLIGVRDNGPIPDYGDADRWLRLAATQGDADAQFWLGTGYERGWFGGTDYPEASSGGALLFAQNRVRIRHPCSHLQTTRIQPSRARDCHLFGNILTAHTPPQLCTSSDGS